MKDFSELKKAAEAVTGMPYPWEHTVRDGRLGKTSTEYALLAHPSNVLMLISESERDKRMLLAACMDMGAIGSALGADMNSDGEELLSMVIDMKAENKRLRDFLSDISKTSGDKGAVMGARQLLKEFGQ